MSFRRTFVCAICSISVMLIGCSGYAITVNEQPVQRPRPLLDPGELADQNLANCLDQTIADRGIRRAEQLNQLVCRYGGIETLVGLEQFSELKQLDLSHNKLTSLEPLYHLAKLEILHLEGNPHLSCGELDTLATLYEAQLTISASEHCR
ncbi:MAG: leucine-rich repeat domain-containing protein [Cellvibrionaceae bacterium]